MVLCLKLKDNLVKERVIFSSSFLFLKYLKKGMKQSFSFGGWTHRCCTPTCLLWDEWHVNQEPSTYIGRHLPKHWTAWWREKCPRSPLAVLGCTRGMAKHREEQESLGLQEAKLNFSACDLPKATKALTPKYPLIHSCNATDTSQFA